MSLYNFLDQDGANNDPGDVKYVLEMYGKAWYASNEKWETCISTLKMNLWQSF